MGEIWCSGGVFRDQGSRKDFQLIHIEKFLFSGSNINIDPHSLPRQLILLQHRTEGLVAKNKMIQNMNTKEFSSL